MIKIMLGIHGCLHQGMVKSMAIESPDSGSVARRRGRAVITVETAPDAAVADELWAHYVEAFTPLEELALLSQMYGRDVWDALMRDTDVVKIIGWNDGRPVGLCLFTNKLDVVPQISPPFLRRRYPEQFERAAVYFGVLVFVALTARLRTLFPRLIATAGEIAAARAGVAVFDICAHNVAELALDDQFAVMASWFPRSHFDRIDTQSYYACVLPEPMAKAPVTLTERTGRGPAPVGPPTVTLGPATVEHTVERARSQVA
jgi:hypothetical protein